MTINDSPDVDCRSVTATFSDGTIVKARLIIGCDGSRSRVRQLLISDDAVSSPTTTPYTILNFPCSYPATIATELRAIHPVFKVAYHPKLNCMYMLSVLDTSTSATSGAITFQNLISWKGPPYTSDIHADPSLALKHLQKLGAQFAPPFSTAAANIPDDTKLFVDQGTQWDPRPHFAVSHDPHSGTRSTSWNARPSTERTITLAGDAAHSMLPHRGQGLNHSLEDAAKLVSALKAVFRDRTRSLADAVAAYEEEMVRRGGAEIEVTAKAAATAHDWGLMMQSPIFKHGANKVR